MRRRGIRILAVDDSPTMRKIIRNQLAEAGFAEVDEAENGRDALERLGHGEYDLLITDWNLREMGGLGLVKEVRKSDATRALPILMITTVTGKEEIVAALKAGVNNVVVKPFDAGTLHAKIARLVPGK
jgi:two-component system chemotaxis response regulator CheY